MGLSLLCICTHTPTHTLVSRLGSCASLCGNCKLLLSFDTMLFCRQQDPCYNTQCLRVTGKHQRHSSGAKFSISGFLAARNASRASSLSARRPRFSLVNYFPASSGMVAIISLWFLFLFSEAAGVKRMLFICSIWGWTYASEKLGGGVVCVFVCTRAPVCVCKCLRDLVGVGRG